MICVHVAMCSGEGDPEASTLQITMLPVYEPVYTLMCAFGSRLDFTSMYEKPGVKTPRTHWIRLTGVDYDQITHTRFGYGQRHMNAFNTSVNGLHFLYQYRIT